MEVLNKFVLQESEVLEDYPNKYLKINEDSNYYYVEYKEKSYIARKLILSLKSNDNGDIFVMFGFFNIVNDKLIAVTKKVITLFKSQEENKNLVAIPLNQIFRIRSNKVYYLNKDDIMELLNFNGLIPNKPQKRLRKVL